MRKIKPRKVREIKFSENIKKEKYRIPTTDEANKIEFALLIASIIAVIDNHLAVWKKEVDEKDGIISKDMLTLLIGSKLVAQKIYDKNFKDFKYEKNPYTELLIQRIYVDVLNNSVEVFYKLKEDVEQRLPAGFMSTVGGMARICRALILNKYKTIIKEYNLEEEIIVMVSSIESYLHWVAKEITFNELIEGFNEEVIKLEENKVTNKDKEVLNNFLEKEKTDAEKKQLEKETAKTVKKKKAKEDTVIKKEEKEVKPGNEISGMFIENILGAKAYFFVLGSLLENLFNLDYKNAKIKLKKIALMENTTFLMNAKESALELKTTWLSMITEVCENMSAKEALILNSVFNHVFRQEFDAALEELETLN